MHYRFAVLIFLLLAVTAVAAPIANIPAIAGKSRAEVAKVLGKFASEEKTKFGPKLSYEKGKIEIVFINGKADWITVSGAADVPFDINALEAIGLKPVPPSFQGPAVIRWEPCGDYTSVSVFPANGKVDYAYIKVATK